MSLAGATVEQLEAAKRWGDGRRLRGAELNELLATATSGANDVHVVLATSTLTFARFGRRRLDDVVRSMLRLVDDRSLTPAIRGHAAEVIGNQLVFSKRARLTRTASLGLIRRLHDPEPEVRFWCAFALGQLRSRRARPGLRTLLGDEAVGDGFWSVGKEAADALATIDGRPTIDAELDV